MTLQLTDPAPKIWGEKLPFWYLALARLGSLFLMITGIYYWADLLGMFGDSGLERGVWQEAAMRVLLACSFLIASVGVWQLTFWGVVMWVLSSISQSVTIAMFDHFAGHQFVVSIVHLVALIALFGCSSWIYFKAKKSPE